MHYEQTKKEENCKTISYKVSNFKHEVTVSKNLKFTCICKFLCSEISEMRVLSSEYISMQYKKQKMRKTAKQFYTRCLISNMIFLTMCYHAYWHLDDCNKLFDSWISMGSMGRIQLKSATNPFAFWLLICNNDSLLNFPSLGYDYVTVIDQSENRACHCPKIRAIFNLEIFESKLSGEKQKHSKLVWASL